MHNPRKFTALAILTVALLLFGAQSALAVGTASGTSVTNQATINFSYGTTSTSTNSNQTSFLVDNMVDLTVALQDTTYVDVAPGSTAQVLTFLVSNIGNTVQDFDLTAANNAADPFFGTENFNPTAIAVYADSNGDGLYNPAVDAADYIDELAADGSRYAFVVSTIGAQSAGDIAAVTLTATANAGGTASSQGGALTQDIDTASPADDPNTVEIVFADAAGDTDNANEADHSDTGAYRVATPDITIVKTSTVIWDPVNGATNPHHIPGAIVRYEITIGNDLDNDGPYMSATLANLTDALNANTVLDPDLYDPVGDAPENAAGDAFRVVINGSARAANGSNQYFTGAADADAVGESGGTVTAALATILAAEGAFPNNYTAGQLKRTESVTLRFNVEIQ